MDIKKCQGKFNELLVDRKLRILSVFSGIKGNDHWEWDKDHWEAIRDYK